LRREGNREQKKRMRRKRSTFPNLLSLKVGALKEEKVLPRKKRNSSRVVANRNNVKGEKRVKVDLKEGIRQSAR